MATIGPDDLDAMDRDWEATDANGARHPAGALNGSSHVNGDAGPYAAWQAGAQDRAESGPTPTAEDPLRGLVHLAKVAVVGRKALVALSEVAIEYVWEPVAMPGWIVMLAGGAGNGKTSLVFQIIAARANVGVPVLVLGRPVQPAPPGKWIVVVEGEIDDVASAKKVRRSMAMHDIDEAALDRLVLVARKGVVVGDSAWVDIERLVAAGLVSDIIIDTVARVCSGDANDEQVQALVFERVTKSIQYAPRLEDRPIVWTCAHTRKGNGIELDDIAGSAQRVAQTDSVLMVGATKTPSGKVVSCTVYYRKLRHDPDVHPEPVTVTVDLDPITGKMRVRTTVVVEDKRPLETRIVEILSAEGPLTRSKLAERVSRSLKDLQPAIDVLFAAGRLTGATYKAGNGQSYPALDVKRAAGPKTYTSGHSDVHSDVGVK